VLDQESMGADAMKNWTELLKDVIAPRCYERPFVCNGFPSASSVIVIGENPATRLDTDWWSYWNDDTGFDYNVFLKQYKIERERIIKQKGKGRIISNTRLRLNRIRDHNIGCIETNTYSNEKPDGSGKGVPNYDLLNVLISNNDNLKAIIAHGKYAKNYLDRATIPDGITTYTTAHFRSLKYEEIDRICAEIKSCDRPIRRT
jgi:hypothetical protein